MSHSLIIHQLAMIRRGSQHAMELDIGAESRFLHCIPHLHSTSPLGGLRRHIAMSLGTGN